MRVCSNPPNSDDNGVRKLGDEVETDADLTVQRKKELAVGDRSRCCGARSLSVSARFAPTHIALSVNRIMAVLNEFISIFCQRSLLNN
jgi:hypothetical protein